LRQEYRPCGNLESQNRNATPIQITERRIKKENPTQRINTNKIMDTKKKYPRNAFSTPRHFVPGPEVGVVLLDADDLVQPLLRVDGEQLVDDVMLDIKTV
jgi:hypothetical protein